MDRQQLLPEIDNHTTKLIVGIIALSLAVLTNLFSSTGALTSISASYWDPGHWPRNIFVGCLFAIAAFLASYNGHSYIQMLLSKIAAVAAICVAMFPCSCDVPGREIVAGVHYTAAAVMFAILAVFCYIFYCRARAKQTLRAQLRAKIYGACGAAILTAMALMLADKFSGGALSGAFGRLTFFAEAMALCAFGVTWLTASRKLPVITTDEDRLPMFPAG